MPGPARGGPALASARGDRPGIKVAWTRQELDRAQAAAHRPAAWFASREEAAARYLRISGLAGLVAADAPAVTAGLREEHERWPRN